MEMAKETAGPRQSRVLIKPCDTALEWKSGRVRGGECVKTDGNYGCQ